nr:hypothetical protein [Marinococcus halotolerans]
MYGRGRPESRHRFRPYNQGRGRRLPVARLDVIGIFLIGLGHLPVKGVLSLRAEPRRFNARKRFRRHRLIGRPLHVGLDHRLMDKVRHALEGVHVSGHVGEKRRAPRGYGHRVDQNHLLEGAAV